MAVIGASTSRERNVGYPGRIPTKDLFRLESGARLSVRHVPTVPGRLVGEGGENRVQNPGREADKFRQKREIPYMQPTAS